MIIIIIIIIIITIIIKSKEGISSSPPALWVLHKEQLLIHFLEKWSDFGQPLKNFGATFEKILSNLWR